MYRFIEYYLTGKSDDWFWALKEKPGKRGVIVYIVVLLLVFVYALTLY